MWAYGKFDLGLSDEEFWGMTPKEFRVLGDRADYQTALLDYRAGVVASVIANTQGKKSTGDPFTVEDFFPGVLKRLGSSSGSITDEPIKKPQTVEEQIDAMQSWMVVFKVHETMGSLPQNPPRVLPGESEILEEVPA